MFLAARCVVVKREDYISTRNSGRFGAICGRGCIIIIFIVIVRSIKFILEIQTLLKVPTGQNRVFFVLVFEHSVASPQVFNGMEAGDGTGGTTPEGEEIEFEIGVVRQEERHRAAAEGVDVLGGGGLTDGNDDGFLVDFGTMTIEESFDWLKRAEVERFKLFLFELRSKGGKSLVERNK